MHHRGEQWSLYIVVRHDIERSGKAIKPFVFNLLFDIQKILLAKFLLKSLFNGNKEPFYSEFC